MIKSQACLGLSDLTEDENLLIGLFRDWLNLGPTAAIAEHRVAILLLESDLYGTLDPVFALFRMVDRAEALRAPLRDRLSAMLSDTEERLLELAAGDEIPGQGLVCRHPSQIPRSGIDRLAARIAASYGVLAAQMLR
ncbi:MAG: hypothetical protein ACK5MQ_02415 [Pikeienuella sp.]